MEPLRIAIVTDIHYGRDSGSRLGSKAPRLMDKFAKAANEFAPDFVVDMGDRISSSSAGEAKESLQNLTSHFNKIAAPTHYLMGNHDLKYLSAADNAAITGSKAESYSLDVKGHHIVFWNASVDTGGASGLVLQKEDLAWLAQDLTKTDKPTIIFSHVPLDGMDMTQDDLGILKRFYYTNAEEAQKVIEASGKVILCMGGHRHQSKVSVINGVPYVSQQSLTNMYQKRYRVAADAFSLLEVDDDGICLDMKGKVRKKLSFVSPTSPV